VNPDTAMIEAGASFAASQRIDSFVALGGGSSLDCAKGINLFVTNGGRMREYHGYGKAQRPTLPMIGIPTTAGTGSEAQTYALISDAATHEKLACGDPKIAFRIALLDPALTISQPLSVTATSGFDAIAHAVETFVTTKRNPLSESFSRQAWKLLEGNYERVLNNAKDIEARGAMQLGAFFAGMAIENSMLGATHACANPLTTHYGTTHGPQSRCSCRPWSVGIASSRAKDMQSCSGVPRPGIALTGWRSPKRMQAKGWLRGSNNSHARVVYIQIFERQACPLMTCPSSRVKPLSNGPAASIPAPSTFTEH
jgi:alcohol dehydrogenase YqhD (iron-dependent ADH family)